MTRSLLFFILFQVSTIGAQEMKLVVLGTAQDGGYPQLACQKPCCAHVQEKDKRFVSSLAMVSEGENEDRVWIFDCSPDFKEQWEMIENASKNRASLQGIFLSHAHIGHYLGLAQLGREVVGSQEVPVYVMPRMKSFLQENGPWDQLVSLGNVKLMDLRTKEVCIIGDDISVVSIEVPHRDEYSECVGFIIRGPNKNVLYIPDIDKWEMWDQNLQEIIESVDYAFLDGTFYRNGELPGRDMSEIPHPFVVETMELLKDLPEKEKNKVQFIHLNHTNPLLWEQSALDEVMKMGFQVAKQGSEFQL